MADKKECKCKEEETCRRMMNAGLKKAVQELKKLEPTDDTVEAIKRCDSAEGACKAIIDALEVYECSVGKKLQKRAEKTLKILKLYGRYESEENAATEILVAEIEDFIRD